MVPIAMNYLMNISFTLEKECSYENLSIQNLLSQSSINVIIIIVSGLESDLAHCTQSVY